MAASVDRLSQIPERLRDVFAFEPGAALADEQLAAELSDPAARAVVESLADTLASAPRLLNREAFRAAAAQVKDRTGQKGKALFHPIRVALTGAAAGPELDVIVPAIDSAADLPPAQGLAPVTGCRERARACATLIAHGQS
jgi:glutamyl-tRNA synthetase/nondiscriminating glutamyl-tRNA synthetase